MKKPENTTVLHREDPLAFLMNAAVMGSSNAIEHQEADGQRSFVGSDTLPVKMDAEDKLALEKAGVKFLGPVEGDAIFQYATLPEGWKKKPTNHSMWSDLVDAKGRKRGAIFYKAAFYDRSAHLTVINRFGIRKDYENEGQIVMQVKDCDMVVFATPAVPEPEGYQARLLAEKEQIAICEAWLNERFPGWRDASAHWD